MTYKVFSVLHRMRKACVSEPIAGREALIFGVAASPSVEFAAFAVLKLASTDCPGHNRRMKYSCPGFNPSMVTERPLPVPLSQVRPEEKIVADVDSAVRVVGLRGPIVVANSGSGWPCRLQLRCVNESQTLLEGRNIHTEILAR